MHLPQIYFDITQTCENTKRQKYPIQFFNTLQLAQSSGASEGTSLLASKIVYSPFPPGTEDGGGFDKSLAQSFALISIPVPESRG